MKVERKKIKKRKKMSLKEAGRAVATAHNIISGLKEMLAGYKCDIEFNFSPEGELKNFYVKVN